LSVALKIKLVDDKNIRNATAFLEFPLLARHESKLSCGLARKFKIKMKNLNRFKKYAVVPAAAVLVLLPLVVLAQLPVPTVPTVPGTSLTEIESLINRIGQFLMVIGVALALIFIIYGGIVWMNAGSEPEKIKNAKLRMKQGAWGALIVLAVGLILQTLAAVVTRQFGNTNFFR